MVQQKINEWENTTSGDLFECLDDNGREFDIDYIKIWRFNPD